MPKFTLLVIFLLLAAGLSLTARTRPFVPPPPRPTPTSTPNPSSGCYYQQVQCIQAPCDPILVCPPPTTYVCPPSGWLDCMPGPDTKPYCQKDYLAWIQTNCPDFQGVAY